MHGLFRTGLPVTSADLTNADHWPRFCPRALEAGFRSADAVPMRLRSSVIGVLNLFRAEPGGLEHADLSSAQALADVATIAVLQNRVVEEARILNEQLEHALNSRVLIEQAKGVWAERTHSDMDRAFSALRGYARSHNLALVAVAQGVIDGQIQEL